MVAAGLVVGVVVGRSRDQRAVLAVSVPLSVELPGLEAIERVTFAAASGVSDRDTKCQDQYTFSSGAEDAP